MSLTSSYFFSFLVNTFLTSTFFHIPEAMGFLQFLPALSRDYQGYIMGGGGGMNS